MKERFYIFRNGIWMFAEQMSKVIFELSSLGNLEYYEHDNSVWFNKTSDIIKILTSFGIIIPLEDSYIFNNINNAKVKSFFSGRKSINLIGDYLFTNKLPILNVFTITSSSVVTGNTETKIKDEKEQEKHLKEVIRKQNYYDFLDLDRDLFTEESLKKSYKKLLFRFHPDHGGKHHEFIYFKEAYEVLIDPNKRKKYDFTLKLKEQRSTKTTSINENIVQRGVLNNTCQKGQNPKYYIQKIANTYLYTYKNITISNCYGIDYKGTLSIKEIGELKCS